MNLKNFSILFLSLTLLSCKKDFIPTESSRIEIDDFIVDEHEVRCIFKGLNESKSCGPDGLKTGGRRVKLAQNHHKHQVFNTQLFG